LITSKFLASELPFHGWKSLEIAWGEIWIEFCFRLGKVDRWNPIRTSAIQSRSRSMRFMGFSNHEKGAPRQEISKWSTVCSTFTKSGWSVVRSALLDKGSASKKRPSLLLHKVPTRGNKVSPRTFQTALVHQLLFPARKPQVSVARSITDMLLTPRIRDLEKLIVASLDKKFPTFYGARRFIIPCSKEPVTGPWSQPVESSYSTPSDIISLRQSVIMWSHLQSRLPGAPFL
jgi:hypothetical protein